jgi:hypothetical protein
VSVFNDEIIEPEEETTMLDCLARVEGLFPQTPIAKFNAFGRIAYGTSTDALRALLARVPPPQDINTSYKLSWAVEDLPFRQQHRLLDSLIAYGFSNDATNVRREIMTIDEPRVLRELLAYIVLNNSPRTCLAQKIGTIPSLNPYVYEIEGSIMPTCAAVVCLLALVGPNHLVYVRTYLRAAECDTLECEHACHMTYSDALCNVAQCKCRQHAFVVPRMLCNLNHVVHPVIFELDIIINTDAAVSCRRSFLSLVRDVRRNVWDEDDDFDVPSIVQLVLSGKLSSVLAPLSILPQKFYDIRDCIQRADKAISPRKQLDQLETDLGSLKNQMDSNKSVVFYRICDSGVQFVGTSTFLIKDYIKKYGATWVASERMWVTSKDCGKRFMVENADRFAFQVGYDWLSKHFHEDLTVEGTVSQPTRCI